MRWFMLVAMVGAFIFVVVMTSGPARWYCGRCGDQRSTFDILGVRFVTEAHYDEFGIVEAWERAHARPCENIWLPGLLDGGRLNEEYWPPLHFAVAKLRIEDLRSRLAAASPDELRRKDALGRTVLHWFAARHGGTARQELVDELIARGASLDARDEDAMTPRDWQQVAEATRLARVSSNGWYPRLECRSSANSFNLGARFHEMDLLTLTFEDERRELSLKTAVTDWRLRWDKVSAIHFLPHVQQLWPPNLISVAYVAADGAAYDFGVGLIDDSCREKLRVRYGRELRFETHSANDDSGR